MEKMLTWFDALLVTVWAAVTVLGVRRGLAGGVWALAALLGLVLANVLPWPIASSLVSLIVGFAAALIARRLLWSVPPRTWHFVVGGFGGAAFGFLVVAALALSFPLRVIGSQATYPSSDLPAPIYNGVYNSALQRAVFGLFGGPPLVRHVLVPDQNRRSP